MIFLIIEKKMDKIFNFLARGIPILINDLRAIASAKTPFL